MDQQTRIDLTMMILDLRLAARGPSELVGRRLSPQRLTDIAAVLEQTMDGHRALGDGAPFPPANDTGLTGGGNVLKLRERA